VPDADKALWQDVLRKPAGKLLVAQCHQLYRTASLAVFIAEAYRCFIYLHNAIVADRYFVGTLPVKDVKESI
jgi:hypothetical protein